VSAALQTAAGSRENQPTDDGIDPLLAVQFSDHPRYDTWTGEAHLALAVVEDAILTVRLSASVRTPRAHRLAAEAWAWLASRDTTDAFAFENLCDHLGLDAAWLRNGVRRLAGHGLTREPLEATPRGARSALQPAWRSVPQIRARSR